MDLAIIDVSAIIFDLDGVLANSIAVLEESWGIWCADKGLDFETVMRVAHGRRKSEILAIVLPGQDPQPEIERLIALEKERMGSVKKIPGAAELVANLPAGRWAIATSGERPAALARLEQVGIAPPPIMISAEDVTNGKPNPEVYLKAAAALGMASDKCMVFEDAPAGIAAALAAGMEAVAVLTTYPASEFPADVPKVNDLTHVFLAESDGDLQITLIS